MRNRGDGLGRRIFESMNLRLEMDPEGTMSKFPVVNEVAFGGREINEIRAGVAGAGRLEGARTVEVLRGRELKKSER